MKAETGDPVQADGESLKKTSVEVFVPGVPCTQGSKKPFVNKHTGRASLVEDRHEDLICYRNNIAMFLRAEDAPLTLGPVSVDLIFYFTRPKNHYGTGRNASVLKPSAPAVPYGSRNDIDKLCRAVLDAMTELAFKDDGQVTTLLAKKKYASGPGTWIRLRYPL